MERLYTDINGRALGGDEFNRHHIFPRCKAKGKGAAVQQFINQRGLVLPMVVETHRDLHAEVPFPHIPSVSLIDRFNGFMRELDTVNLYDRFLAFTDYVTLVAETTGHSDHRAQCERIAENLAKQAPFILEGQVLITPLQEAA